MKTKPATRAAIRQRKTAYSAEELTARSGPILHAVEQLPEFQEAQIVAAYWSLPDEVYTHAFVERWCEKKTLLLPVMCDGNRLELRPYRKGCTLTQAAFCIREPEGEAYSAHPDLILVPGMAFDRHNHRLGRGKGYYDRLLKEIDAYKVGICFDFQFFDLIPTDAYDVAMDRVITG